MLAAVALMAYYTAKIIIRDEKRENNQPKQTSDGPTGNWNYSWKDQVQHQTENRRPQRIHARALNKAEAAKVFHLLEFQLQDFSGRVVQALDFLMSQAEALHEFNIS